LYSVLSQLLEPYTLLVIASLGVCVAAWRSARWREQVGPVAIACFALLLVLSTPAAKFVALGSLEWWYRPESAPPSSRDTVVVLAGGQILEDARGERIRLSDTSLTRCLEALRLYRQASGCRLVLSGGKVDAAEPGLSLAASMREFLLQCGVMDSDIVLEDQSSTTYENALRSKDLIPAEGPGKVYLVTTAYHMWRSEGCFRRLGVEVVPAPCDFHAQFFKADAKAVLPSANGVQGVNDAAHEWIGLAWYWLAGRV